MSSRLADLLQSLSVATSNLGARYPDFLEASEFVPRLVSPLAEGADQLAAQVALDQGYALEAILPFPRENYQSDFGGAGLALFNALLARASRVLELPLQPGERAQSYAMAGRATVAQSDVLIALWDGGPARGIGGTAEVVELAFRRGIPVIHLPLDTELPAQILWAGYSDLVHHSDLAAVARRDCDAAEIEALVEAILGPPDDPSEARHLRRYLYERERLLRPRLEYPLLLAALGIKRLRRASLLGERYEAANRAEWQSFRSALDADKQGIAVPLDDLEGRFGWADRLAQHFAQSYRSGHILNFLLGAMAVLIALTGMVFPHLEFWTALCEPIAITGFVINTGIGTRHQWHRRWLEYRQLAERIRPMRSLKLLCVALPPGLGEGSGSSRRWVEWYAAAAWRDAGCPSGRIADTDALVDLVVREDLEPQISYHRSSARQLHRLDHRLHRMGMVLFLATVLSCLSAVVANLFAHEFAKAHAHLFIAVSAGLPAIGAAIFGIRMQGDFGASAQRSSIVADRLSRIALALRKAGPELAGKTDLVEAAASAMLAELDDWHRAYAHRRLELP